MTWHQERMTAFDLETTGVDPESARIVTATLVHIEGSAVTAREWLVNPGVPIPAEAAAIHGVTDEEAQENGDDPTIACAQILADLDEAWTGGRPVVIYNAPYDLTLLDRELRRHCGTSLDGVIGPVIDPFVIDKHMDPYRKGKRTLTATCEHYQVRLEAAHTSSGDAIAVARLAWRLAEIYPQLHDLAEVNPMQSLWRAKWAKKQRRTEPAAKQALEGEVKRRWRALALAIKAKLEVVETGISTFEAEFLPHTVMPDGRTVAEHVLPTVAAAYELGRMPKTLLAIEGTAS